MSKRTIKYTEKITGAKTVYTDMDATEKTLMIDTLSRAYLELLEKMNYNEDARTVFNWQDKEFRKHQASGDPKLYNSLGSFMAGILRQHYKQPNKDLSNKMLEGLATASRAFGALGIDCPEYHFEKVTSRRLKDTSQFDRMFG